MTTLTILPGLSLVDRISVGDHESIDKNVYSLVNEAITEKRFPYDVSTVGEWEYKLVQLNRKISSNVVKSEIETDDFVSAQVEHLLAFRAAFPEKKWKYPIIALGSVCDIADMNYVLGFVYIDDVRHLELYNSSFGWDMDCHFLVVRKI